MIFNTRLIHEIPEDTQPKYHSWIGIKRSSQVIVLKSKTITLGNGIQVLNPNISSEASDSEVGVSSNIRTNSNFSLGLIEELAYYG